MLVPRGIPLFWEPLLFMEASRSMYAPHLMSALNLLSQMSWFLSMNILRLAVCAYNSLSPLLLRLVSLPTLSLSCSFIFIAWANVVAVKTEQNKTKCTGFCSLQALISIFLPDLYLFLYIRNSSWFSSGLGFPNSFALSLIIWTLSSRLQQELSWHGHKPQISGGFQVWCKEGLLLFIPSSKWPPGGALKLVPEGVVLTLKMGTAPSTKISKHSWMFFSFFLP